MKTTITRSKLLLLLCSSTALIYLHSLVIMTCVFLILSIISLLTKSWSKTIKRFLSICLVASFVILFQVVFNASVPLLARLSLGILAAVRIISLSLLVFIFAETTSVSDIARAFSFLPKQISLLLTISLALIPSILLESQSIRLAQQARGYSMKGWNIVRGFVPLVIPLLSRTLVRAERIAMVLESRGYNG